MNKTKINDLSAEIKKYSLLFKNIPDDKKKIAEKLYSQAAFMEMQLNKLQHIIEEEGPIITGTNGNGFNVRSEHPAQKSYNMMIKNYNSTIRQLMDLLPEGTDDGDMLTDYLKCN